MRRVEIYFFSGTGNSLFIAQKLAGKLEGTLIPIVSTINQSSIHTDAEVIGIVCPVYYTDLPSIVEEFSKKLMNIEQKYVFAVCTFGGGVGKSFISLNQILKSRGGELTAAYGIHMPQNAFLKPWENKHKIIEESDRKVENIVKEVIARESYLPFNPILNLLGSLFHIIIKPMLKRQFITLSHGSPELSIKELMHLSDGSYCINQGCNGCGICAQVCPVDNIEMRDNKPVWLHQCETCLGCYNWCPQHAIEGGISSKGYYYQNPRVKLQEMIRYKHKNA